MDDHAEFDHPFLRHLVLHPFVHNCIPLHPGGTRSLAQRPAEEIDAAGIEDEQQRNVDGSVKRGPKWHKFQRAGAAEKAKFGGPWL